MLAEIFMLRLETAMRAAKESAVKEAVANGRRFVPITLLTAASHPALETGATRPGHQRRRDPITVAVRWPPES
jgi:hypothetical protein